MTGREPALFVLLCLIWGTTWIAMKAGVDSVPPLLFAGSRFLVAGSVLLAISSWKTGWKSPARADLPLLIGSTLCMITLCYGLLFWGMQFVSSGLAGVLEMSLTPISLLCFALLLGDEHFNRARAGAVVLGTMGIVILFFPSATENHHPRALIGSAAVSAAAVAYGFGAVLSRSLSDRYSSLYLSAFMMMTGGSALLMLGLAFEPGVRDFSLQALPIKAVGGWLYLVLFGSLLGYPIYMHLLRVWGSSRSGSYTFVSSVVAVVAGWIVFGEQLGLWTLCAMVILLLAAWLAMRPLDDQPFEASTPGSIGSRGKPLIADLSSEGAPPANTVLRTHQVSKHSGD